MVWSWVLGFGISGFGFVFVSLALLFRWTLFLFGEVCGRLFSVLVRAGIAGDDDGSGMETEMRTGLGTEMG